MVRPAPVRSGLVAPTRAIRYDLAPSPAAPATTITGPSIDLIQTDTLTSLVGKACSHVAGAEFADRIELREAGPAGSVNRALSITTEPIQRWIYMGSALGEPGQVLWESGVWTVRFNVSVVTAGDGRLGSVHICRVDSVGVNKGTVASTTDLDIPLTIGVKTVTLSGIETAGADTDRIQIVLGMRKATAPAAAIEFRPNQVINTPILLKTAA